MKKIITASIVAIMAVTAANADIASTTYVTSRTGTVSFDSGAAKGKTNLTEAIKAVDAALGTTTGNAATKTELQGAQQALQANIDKKVDNTTYSADKTAQAAVDKKQTEDIASNADAISKLNNTYATDQQLTDGLALKVDKTTYSTDKTAQAAVDKKQTEDIASNADAISKLDNTYATDQQLTSGLALKVDNTTYNTFVQNQSTKDSGQDGKISALEASLGEGGATAEAIANLQSTVDALDSTYATDAQATDAAKAATDALNANSVGAEGSFISTVSQTKGTIAAGKTAFVGEINEASKNSTIAPQTKAVKTYVDAQIQTVSSESGGRFDDVEQSVADLNAATVKRAQVGIAESFGISDACKQKDVICSLTVKGTGSGAVAQWEVVQP